MGDEVTQQEIEIFLANLHLPLVKNAVVDGGKITEQEVLDVIGKLKLGKAPGTDGLTGWHFSCGVGVTHSVGGGGYIS